MKKDYSIGDGTAIKGWAKITTKLRHMMCAACIHATQHSWVNVEDLTLWKRRGKYQEEYDKIPATVNDVRRLLEEYRDGR